MQIIHTLNNNHIEQLYQLYQGEWWSTGRSLEQTRQCVNQSSLCIGITSHTHELIGFVRILTDYTFKAFIFDLIVKPSERGKGIGKQLLHHIKNNPSLQAVRHFELYCLPDRVSYYTQQGFSCQVGGIQLMRFTPSHP